MASRNTKPGSPTPVSGQYIEVGPRGGAAGRSEVTGVRGKPMPPTSKPGNLWKLTDPTKHEG